MMVIVRAPGDLRLTGVALVRIWCAALVLTGVSCQTGLHVRPDRCTRSSKFRQEASRSVRQALISVRQALISVRLYDPSDQETRQA